MHFPSTSEQQPCKRGHTAGREGNGTCIECRRHNARRRYRTDPVVKAKSKAGANTWKKANPDKVRAKGRAYRKNNPAQTLLESARDRARRGGYLCTITVHDIVIPGFCPLLGIKLESGRGVGSFKTTSPSLDKIRPELGHVPGNVWVISYRANMIKNDATLRELQMLVDNLAKTYVKFPWEN